MKPTLIPYMLIGLFVGFVSGDESPPQRPQMLTSYKELQEQPWLSFSVSLMIWAGDHSICGPTILLQKSKDNSIIVSWNKDSEADGLPIVSNVSSKVEGETFKNELFELFGKALRESVNIRTSL